ncbi:PTS mannose/fructose/sorbose/N-acetylgalactosamine transporter subunit IIC [Sporanaerobacter sp. PP17-6a]|jgi:PTS system mannose-specific IIC component|uniref:PTS mannose/fructose/sorbose/N-acetylgalactosamine transporter subunit IIC n=1 Tax=Sporanaerobacter sp. PP17-6a TaxID=1891289 RepID=UPI0008A071A0|nr:PTS sugar transporter subunit IIC [Sporanaerobacter sp. PP17-6a]SCL94763.1 PTS system mannose-specific EIIC component [Sporanaerobacter sp. PP17-6a]
MRVSILQAVLIGILYYLTVANSPWFTGLASVSIRQPIVAGTIVGIILGEPKLGLIIGATINTMYIGFISAGGAVASEPGIAGIVGTTLAILSKASPGVAISLAVPFGLLGTVLWNTRMTMNSFFVQRMDAAAEKGDFKKIAFISLVPAQLATLALTGIPVALIVYFGGDFAKGLISALEGKPLAILSAIGSILPAIGIAITLKNISNRKGIIAWFLLGFFASVYFKLPMSVLAVFACIIAYFYGELKFKKEEEV